DGIRVFHVTGVQTCALPIFSGDERAFCAGADLSGMPTDPNLRFDQYRERFNVNPHRQLYRTLCFYTKPVISAVEGYCLGGGFEKIGRASCRERVWRRVVGGA